MVMKSNMLEEELNKMVGGEDKINSVKWWKTMLIKAGREAIYWQEGQRQSIGARRKENI